MNIPHFSASQINLLVSELNENLHAYSLSTCVAQSLSDFQFQFFKQTQKKILSFWFKAPVRFHLTSTELPQNSFFHPLHKQLAGMTLHSIEQINQDRIVKFSFHDTKKTLFFLAEFFLRHPNFYLLDQNNRITYSLYPSKNAVYEPPKNNKPIIEHECLFSNSAEIEVFYQEIERKYLFEQEKQSLRTYFHKELKKLENKREKLNKNLEECLSWEKVKHEAELLKANYPQIKRGLAEVKVWDWVQEGEIVLLLDPKLTPQEQIAKRFQRARKLQDGENPLSIQLDLINSKIYACHLKVEALEGIERFEDLIPFRLASLQQASPKEALKKKTLPYHEFRSETGVLIWVGKNALSNEKLTFVLAHGNDWWLHVNGFSGSHIVIKTLRGQEPDQEAIEDALQLALFHSKAKAGKEGEVCITQRKFVSRLGKSQPGKVQISKHKTLNVRLDEQRLQAIKRRNARGD
jgi:predicted ribosome quality control (RQC) complex YloA/Tae2 family protein